MNENYIVINGKKTYLTEEQLKQFWIYTNGKKNNQFDKVTDGGSYYFINSCADVLEDSRDDDALFKSVNYFNDKSIC